MSSYEHIMSRKGEILKKSTGFDYAQFKRGKLAFAYEEMMAAVGYSLDAIRKIQSDQHVGNTPLLELKNLTRFVRKFAPPGKGARIFVKDEAANPCGSFKDRRASVSVYEAAQKGYKGVAAATSGNYGAAVAAQAAKLNLNCIILQEMFDSKGVGQPEIIEKGRKCEALGAEVVQLSVGPELFYYLLKILDETGYFNASLYTPFSVAGIETLGVEIAEQMQNRFGCRPDVVLATHAGGGNLTGTARGLLKAGSTDTEIIGVSINLQGLHMAGDVDFNRKSCTTGHTGFGVPFATVPDRSDVPFNAARVLRYMDRYVTVSQGEVFYVTEALACLEGMERGPAGNTSMTAAVVLAAEMDQDKTLVVQETEYTGAGKHHAAQLTFAEENGVEVKIGNPREEIPGRNIIIPEKFEQLRVTDIPLEKLKQSYTKNALAILNNQPNEKDIEFICEDTRSSKEDVMKRIERLTSQP